jgi:hypothetical protein
VTILRLLAVLPTLVYRATIAPLVRSDLDWRLQAWHDGRRL